ncbi:MAG: hypothetical protein JO022_22130, partial [Acidobacteriaceae bacterium]|nr:hypothetical protein [Acidobacteriaceae bacterium]
ASPQARILDGRGNDITSQITEGQLAASLQIQNSNIPGYQASLDTLAKGLADQVNAALAQGVDASGAAPSTNLFTYNPAGAASTLAVTPSFTPDQIAAASPGAPGGNGNALSLAALGTAVGLNGYTFTGFYGSVATQVGQDISDAQSSSDAQNQVLTQAQNLRQQVSGVSLDEEAANLVEWQKAYDATSKMISVVNSLTDSALSLIPTTG